jgi:hypothetical protein
VFPTFRQKYSLTPKPLSLHIIHKSQVLLDLTDHQSIIHQKDFLRGTSLKRSLICGGRERKNLQRRFGVCPIQKKRKGQFIGVVTAK